MARAVVGNVQAACPSWSRGRSRPSGTGPDHLAPLACGPGGGRLVRTWAPGDRDRPVRGSDSYQRDVASGTRKRTSSSSRSNRVRTFAVHAAATPALGVLLGVTLPLTALVIASSYAQPTDGAIVAASAPPPSDPPAGPAVPPDDQWAAKTCSERASRLVPSGGHGVEVVASYPSTAGRVATWVDGGAGRPAASSWLRARYAASEPMALCYFDGPVGVAHVRDGDPALRLRTIEAVTASGEAQAIQVGDRDEVPVQAVESR